MISKYSKNDIKEIIDLGLTLNSKFDLLFDINELNNFENILVYRTENKVNGFLHYIYNDDILEILNLVVKENQRRKNIASSLVEKLFLENKRILLEVKKSNLPAISLYEKNGFKIINTRKKYYENDDGIVMERGLK